MVVCGVGVVVACVVVGKAAVVVGGVGGVVGVACVGSEVEAGGRVRGDVRWVTMRTAGGLGHGGGSAGVVVVAGILSMAAPGGSFIVDDGWTKTREPMDIVPVDASKVKRPGPDERHKSSMAGNPRRQS